MAAERKLSVDSLLERAEPQFFQPFDLRSREPLAFELGQGPAAP